MKTIKLSHSILSAWASGQYEEAIGMYLGKDLPATPAMELGKLKHEIWEKYIIKNGSLPPELGGNKLVEPMTEQKWQKIIPLSDDYQILLRGVIDLEDEDVITDFKCGFSTPTSYLDKVQLDYYKLLRPNATVGQYICHNSYICDVSCKGDEHKCYKVGIKFLDDKVAENALEHIITFGSEIIQYLEANKLIKDYKIK